MTNQEAIETIKANYPPENYSMLREALDIAIALLKEQEPVKPIRFTLMYWRCGNCRRKIDKYEGDVYCPRCGRRVDWENEYPS